MLPAPIECLYSLISRRLPITWRIRAQYLRSFRRLPRLSNPQTFSEKIQATKLSNSTLIPRLADKVLVKEYVRDRIGSEYVIPTLFAGTALPQKRDWPLPFVIKCNHGSGLNIFVRSTPDWPAIETKLSEFLAYDFSRAGAELFYAKIPRQVLVEPFISKTNELPVDYKLFVFNGQTHCIQVDTAREKSHRRAFFSPEWTRLNIRFGFPIEDASIEKPKSLDKMLWAASRLGDGIGFARIDFYDVEGHPYFGEITFTPESGYVKFEPASVDQELGKLWSMPPA